MKLASVTDRLSFVQNYLIRDMGAFRKIVERKPFTFFNVRHPYERLVSAYTMFRAQNREVGRDTFEEFIREEVLLKSNLSENKMGNLEMEPHLRPSNSYCAFCNIKYDVVSMMETFHEDTMRIKELLGLDDPKVETRLRINTGDKILNMTRNYFKNISMGDKEELKKLYQFDFAMFDYNPDLY